MPVSDLAQRIYPKGTSKADIPYHFHGLTLLEWQALWMHEQCEAYLESLGTVDARNRAYVERHGKVRSTYTPLV